MKELLAFWDRIGVPSRLFMTCRDGSGPRPRSTDIHGRPGATGGSYAENIANGCSVVDTRGMPSASATKGAVNVST